MSASAPRWLAAGAVLLVTTGCASVPRDAGLSEVQRIVAERTGQQLRWDPAQPVEPPATSESVESLLADELTVDRAVEFALANNRDLLATLEELGIARADLIAASTIRNPLVQAEVHTPGAPFKPYEVAVTQTLVDLLRLRSRRASGRAAFEAARLRVSGGVLAFAAEVRTDYFGLQGAQLVLAQQRTIATAAEAAAELARSQHDAGNISDLDLEREQVSYERGKLDLAQAELVELLARERLVADLGLLEARQFTLPAAAAVLPAEPEPTAEEVMAALPQRLDVEVAQAELDAARRALPAARSAAFEELAAGVHWDREAGGERSRGPIGVIPIPFFDRGLAAHTRAVAVLRRAEQRLHGLTVAARSEARTAHERLLAARARAEYLRDVVVPRRQRILQLAQLEYDAMLRGAFDVVRARQELSAAERDLGLALRDYWLARSDLEVAMSGVARFAPERGAAGIAGRTMLGAATIGQTAEGH